MPFSAVACFYLWRPFLEDQKDDLVLEAAVVSQCEYVITFNQRVFQGIEVCALKAVTPKEFLEKRGLQK
jgi:predicted nucleic acid-binding protein